MVSVAISNANLTAIQNTLNKAASHFIVNVVLSGGSDFETFVQEREKCTVKCKCAICTYILTGAR